MIKRFHNGLRQLGNLLNIDVLPLTSKWVSIYEHRLKHRGKADAVKFMKNLNTAAERIALRQKVEPIPWTKSDKNGVPRIIGDVFKRNLQSSDSRRVIMALSVMRTVELLMLPISKDISTVVEPPRFNESLLEDILDFIPLWVKRVTKPLNLKVPKYHFTVKAGPNGHALIESDSDMMAVMKDERLFEAIRIVESELKDKRPLNSKGVTSVRPNEIHSKLCQFPDKAGKTRTIAVIDYFSQRCLKPLHESLMDLLKSLVTDGTYSHQAVGKFAQKFTSRKGFIYCADLTAATDRFPAEIQKYLLLELLQNDNLAGALWALLAERTFKLQWSDETVTYQCGQPMGCYASWPLFALAHHLVVEYCAFKAGMPTFRSYRLIGDDVIITNERVAQFYQKVMTALGVEINLGKTVISPKASEFSCAEVAKQLYLNGTCLTPITPGFIRDLSRPYMFNTCVKTLLDRYEFLGTEIPSMLIDTFYSKSTKARRLVWLLASNPLNGVIKPDFSGYNEMSPWVSRILEKPREYYCKIILAKLLDQAMAYVDQSMEYLMSRGSPWKDSTRPQPKVLRIIHLDIQKKLTEATDRLGDIVVDPDQLEALVAEFDFIPNPELPYMERKELRQRRISSIIESLYEYKDDINWTRIDW